MIREQHSLMPLASYNKISRSRCAKAFRARAIESMRFTCWPFSLSLSFLFFPLNLLCLFLPAYLLLHLSVIHPQLAALPEEKRKTIPKTEFAIFVVHNKLKPKAATLPSDIMYFAGEELGDVWVDYREFFLSHSSFITWSSLSSTNRWLIFVPMWPNQTNSMGDVGHWQARWTSCRSEEATSRATTGIRDKLETAASSVRQ